MGRVMSWYAYSTSVMMEHDHIAGLASISRVSQFQILGGGEVITKKLFIKNATLRTFPSGFWKSELALFPHCLFSS